MSRNTPPFVRNFSAWMSKLHATCPTKDFEEENFFSGKLQHFSDVEPKFFRHLCQIFRQGCQTGILGVHKLLWEDFCSQKTPFLILFGLERNVFSCWSKFFRRGCQHGNLHVHGKFLRRIFNPKDSLFESFLGFERQILGNSSEAFAMGLTKRRTICPKYQFEGKYCLSTFLVFFGH